MFPVLITAQNGIYTVEIEKSKVDFKINHLGVLNVDGKFKQFEGGFEFKDNSISNANMSISVASIFTDNDERDSVILTEPYLNAEAFPNIEFKGQDNTESGTRNELKGELTIRGNTRTIDLPYELEYDPETDAFILTTETMINRKDFDLIFGTMNGLIGNKIRIQLLIVARK